MRINRKVFYDNYRAKFGRLSQPLVDNLNFLLNKFAAGVFKLPTQMAYMLATIKHETNNTFHPVMEGYYLKSNRIAALYSYYRKHNPGALNTIFPNGVDQPTYEGRGYVQITHLSNYRRFNIENVPEKALEPETAYHIMEYGMANGTFTGKRLQDFVNETETDYYGARRVINGKDKASLIAGYAEDFAECIELVAAEFAMQGYNQEEILA